MSGEKSNSGQTRDASVVEQLLARQEEFMRLYTQHEPMVHGLVISLLPSWDDAAEVMQETSLTLWRKFAEFEPGTNFLRWASRVAEFEVRRFRTRKHRSRLQFSDEALNQIAEVRLEATEVIADRRRALNGCLSKLPADDRTLLLARYAERRSGRDIAADQGRPADTIYKSLKRIREKLQECIRRTLAREEHP
jgi:RNA polymerase sigma-70 factor (ECF subfamily)